MLRLATRRSHLALTQSRHVADAIERLRPGVTVELMEVVTSGDRIQDRPLHELGGKGLFTKEIELALLRGEADLAVHSLKDVPVTMPLVEEAQAELVIAAVPQREDVRDCLVTRDGCDLADLPHGARVGTSSLRRRQQLLMARPDLQVSPLRGNVETRLAKVREGELDATLLAMAGLRRLGAFDDSTMRLLPVEAFVPAAGQGALAVQCRRADARTGELLSVLDHAQTRRATVIEREVVRQLEGNCASPIGAFADVAAGLAFAFEFREGRGYRTEEHFDHATSIGAVAAALTGGLGR